MEPDYFSIDDILAENQKVQLIMTESVKEMGHLAGGRDRHLAEGTKIQIPIWLVYVFVWSGWATLQIPGPYTQRIKNALKAEPKSVRLSPLVGAGATWYGFGKTIMEMLGPEQQYEFSEAMATAFRERLPEVIDQAQHFAALGSAGGSAAGGGPQSTSAQSFREGMDATERELFTLAQESARKTKKWHDET